MAIRRLEKAHVAGLSVRRLAETIGVARARHLTLLGSLITAEQKAGQIYKLVGHVERITFAADYARQHGQEVLYVTERAVFRLDTGGVRLVEVAPGIDIERDILPYMDFKPLIDEVATMDISVFS